MKKAIILLYLFCGILSLFFYACKKNTFSANLSISSNNKLLSFSNDTGTFSFSITTNTSWEIYNLKNNLRSTWYRLSDTSGNGNKTVYIKVNKNIYPYMRFDTLYIHAESLLDTIFIAQSAITASNTLLVSFQNLFKKYKDTAVLVPTDSVLYADITLRSPNGIITTYPDVIITNTGNTFSSSIIPTPAGTSIIASVFKNPYKKIRGWWNYNNGEILPCVIDINNSKYYFDQGSGTSSDPYVISNPMQLYNLRWAYHDNQYITINSNMDLSDAIGLVRNNSNNGFDIIKNDTNAIFYNNGTGWIPMGTTYGGLPFRGTFDGRSHSITLYMNRTTRLDSSQISGLFGVVGSTGTIQNLLIDKNSLIIGNNSVGSIVGSLQGGTVQNCYNAATIMGTQFIGGIVGSVQGGTITSCSNQGNIILINNKNNYFADGYGYAGGIAGGIYNGTSISNCYNNATISSTSNAPNYYVGGLVGFCIAENPNIQNSYNAGGVTVPSSSENMNTIGGLIGFVDNTVTAFSINNCFYLEDVNQSLSAVGNKVVANTNVNKTTLQGYTNQLNNGQSPAPWKADNQNINGGFPILNWQ